MDAFFFLRRLTRRSSSNPSQTRQADGVARASCPGPQEGRHNLDAATTPPHHRRLACEWLEERALLSIGGSGWTSDAVRALNYATMMKTQFGVNVRLTSNSWGGGGYDQATYNAIQASGNAGMLFVAAAGNSGTNNDASPFYPASYNLDNLIAVAATDHNDSLASFSCYGPTSVDLAAPGVNVYSTVPGGYASLSGTSMATPHVSGVAALAWSTSPDSSYQQIRDVIFQGVDPIASLSGRVATGGRLNARKTLDALGMQVRASDPAAGQVVTSPITQVQIDFSAPFEAASVQAADLAVNGVAASGFPSRAVSAQWGRTLNPRLSTLDSQPSTLDFFATPPSPPRTDLAKTELLDDTGLRARSARADLAHQPLAAQRLATVSLRPLPNRAAQNDITPVSSLRPLTCWEVKIRLGLHLRGCFSSDGELPRRPAPSLSDLCGFGTRCKGEDTHHAPQSRLNAQVLQRPMTRGKAIHHDAQRTRK